MARNIIAPHVLKRRRYIELGLEITAWVTLGLLWGWNAPLLWLAMGVGILPKLWSKQFVGHHRWFRVPNWSFLPGTANADPNQPTWALPIAYLAIIALSISLVGYPSLAYYYEFLQFAEKFMQLAYWPLWVLPTLVGFIGLALIDNTGRLGARLIFTPIGFIYATLGAPLLNASASSIPTQTIFILGMCWWAIGNVYDSIFPLWYKIKTILPERHLDDALPAPFIIKNFPLTSVPQNILLLIIDRTTYMPQVNPLRLTNKMLCRSVNVWAINRYQRDFPEIRYAGVPYQFYHGIAIAKFNRQLPSFACQPSMAQHYNQAHLAAIHGDLATLQRLYRTHQDVLFKTKSPDGLYPIQYAAALGRTGCFNFLYKYYPIPAEQLVNFIAMHTIQFPDGQPEVADTTLFRHAAHHGSAKLQWLLDKFPHTPVETLLPAQGTTVLHTIAESDNFEGLAYLFEYYGILHRDLLISTLRNQDPINQITPIELLCKHNSMACIDFLNAQKEKLFNLTFKELHSRADEHLVDYIMQSNNPKLFDWYVANYALNSYIICKAAVRYADFKLRAHVFNYCGQKTLEISQKISEEGLCRLVKTANPAHVYLILDWLIQFAENPLRANVIAACPPVVYADFKLRTHIFNYCSKKTLKTPQKISEEGLCRLVKTANPAHVYLILDWLIHFAENPLRANVIAACPQEEVEEYIELLIMAGKAEQLAACNVPITLDFLVLALEHHPNNANLTLVIVRMLQQQGEELKTMLEQLPQGAPPAAKENLHAAAAEVYPTTWKTLRATYGT